MGQALDDVDEIRLTDDTADEDRAVRIKEVRDANLAKGRLVGRRKRLGKGTKSRRVVVNADGSEEEKPRSIPRIGGNGITRGDISNLLDIVDGLVVPQLGETAAFNARERGLIEPSLARIAARMTPAGAAVFGALADPLMLGTGLLLWGLRISAARQPAGPPPGTRTGPFVPSGGPAPARNGPTAIRPEDMPHAPPAPPDPNGVAHPDGLMTGGL